MKPNQNILLVDDHLVVRKGIALILKDKLVDPIIYNAENYDDALELIKTTKLNLVMLDININGIENIKIMKLIKTLQPDVKILIFSSHDEKQYGLRYIQQGADGFLNKFCSENLIVVAIQEVLENGCYYSEQIRQKLNSKKVSKGLKNPIDALSNREYEVAVMLNNGLGNLEIANKLDIQMSTVSTYKNRIFEKLNVNNVVALSDLFKSSLD